jgi:hypothetical protein
LVGLQKVKQSKLGSEKYFCMVTYWAPLEMMDALICTSYLSPLLPFLFMEERIINSQDVVVGTCWKELKPLGYHCSTRAFISFIHFWPEKYNFGTFGKDFTQKEPNLPDFYSFTKNVLLPKFLKFQNWVQLDPFLNLFLAKPKPIDYQWKGMVSNILAKT